MSNKNTDEINSGVSIPKSGNNSVGEYFLQKKDS